MGGVHWIAVYKFVLVFKGSNLKTSKHLKFPSFGSRCSPPVRNRYITGARTQNEISLSIP